MSGKSVLAGAAGGAVLGAGAVVAGLAAAAAGVGALATLALEGLGTAAAGALAAVAEQGVAGEQLCLPCAVKAGGVAGALTVLTLGVGRVPAVQRVAGRLGAWLGETRAGLWAKSEAGQLAAAARRLGARTTGGPAAGATERAAVATRVRANVAASQQAREASAFEAHLARSDQLRWGYAADEWHMTSLPAGSRVYGGLPGQSAYYTSEQTVADASASRATLFQSLQVRPHPEFGYRPQIGVYEVANDIRVPTGTVLANPEMGTGGGAQYFVRRFGKQLQLIDRIDFGP